MSGAEFVAVAAVASSIIAIIDGMNQVFQAALDAEGLPKVFRRASHKLEIISEILEATRSILVKKDATAVDSAIQKTIERCQSDWQNLKELFEKVIPDEGASRMERYRKAARTLGKGSKVELLMKDLLENVQLLATFKIMTEGGEEVIESNVNTEKLEKHIAEVESWEPSLPDDAFEEESYTMQVSGSGHSVVQGENVKQNNLRDNARQIKVQGDYHENVSHTINKPMTVEEINQACLRFLKCPDTLATKTYLKETKDKLILKSMDWILRDPKYKQWKEGNTTCLLWIKGGAGKGKTMMANIPTASSIPSIRSLKVYYYVF